MKLNESPNTIYFDNESVSWKSKDAYAFAYYFPNDKKLERDDELYISDDTHGDLKRTISFNCKKYSANATWISNWEMQDWFQYSGRIWLNKKVIAFWDFPKKQFVKEKLIHDLEDYFNINIKNNAEWLIEKNKNKYETVKYWLTGKKIDYAQWKRTQHVKAGRFGRKVPDGVGSESKKYGKLSTTQAHQMMRTSESKLRNIIRKIIINEMALPSKKNINKDNFYYKITNKLDEFFENHFSNKSFQWKYDYFIDWYKKQDDYPPLRKFKDYIKNQGFGRGIKDYCRVVWEIDTQEFNFKVKKLKNIENELLRLANRYNRDMDKLDTVRKWNSLSNKWESLMKDIKNNYYNEWKEYARENRLSIDYTIGDLIA